MPDVSELKNVPILRHLSDSDLEALVAVLTERDFGPGDVIFEEGVEQDSLFIILSGDVLISKETHTGDRKSMATLGAGAFFGEMALFDDFVRSATATATNDVRALEMSKSALMEFIASECTGASRLMHEIMRTVAPRIRQTNDELVALYEAGRIIGGRAEAGRMLSELLALLSDATSCARGAVFLLNAPAQQLECRAAFGYDEDPSTWIEPLDGGIAEVLIEAEGAVVIENFERDARFESLQPVGYETQSMLGAAFCLQGEPIGTIVLCDKFDAEGNPCPFTSGDANLLAGVAAQASGAIESARLHEDAFEKEKLDRVYFRH
jgi:CRP-like cAMP-binding protein